ncbi:MAG: helix-turn-helix domain-containing protein [Lachnospiraceae bacterium]|nr:helix-turn-helix domain-containing protein [Candidatus Minthocola equi]
MLHKAISLTFKEGTTLELGFQDGVVKEYDMAQLFSKYPQLEALRDRTLFLSGKLTSPYGIIWNDDLDIEADTIYEDGITIRHDYVPVNLRVGNAVAEARARYGLSQQALSEATGIDQSDISKIERGVANPSIMTLNRIADALGAELTVHIGEKLCASSFNLDRIRELISPVAEKYRLRSVYVFGSYARKEETADSDIDIMIDREGSKIHGIFAMNALLNELKEVLGKEVDVVTEQSLKQKSTADYNAEFIENVMRERVKIYG